MGIFSKSSIAEYIVTILVLVSSLPSRDTTVAGHAEVRNTTEVRYDDDRLFEREDQFFGRGTEWEFI